MTDIALAPQWDPNSGAALPAYLSDALGDLGSNIADRNTVPSLSYEGKTWQIVKDGNKTKLQAKNSDGDMVPVPVMRVVVLNYNPDRGRSFYEGVYNPAATSSPKCWSADSVAPDASVKEKQSATCAACPQSVRGSKVQEGREMVACSSHRMIAVAPAFDLSADPLRLKIAVTSDYDKEVVEHGWFAFRQYTDWLKSRGVAHTGLVVTKIKFDPNTAYPKLLFALDRVLTQEEIAQVKAMLAGTKVTELLAEKWTAAGAAGTPINDSDIKPFGLEGAYADGWVAHPDSAGWSYKGQEVVKNDELAARYPAPTPAPAAETKTVVPATPAAQQVVDVVPTVVEQTAPAPIVAAHDPLVAAMADGWLVHPQNPDYYYKGSEVVATADVMAKYPAQAPVAAAPAAPVVPAAPPAPAQVNPLVAAVADGWAVHPDNGAYWFKGSEVVAVDDLKAKYPVGNALAAAAPTPSTPAPATAAASGASPSNPTVAATATNATLPPEVQGLLDKWAG